MKLALYAHPFDLDALAAHGGLARLTDLGIGEVAMATSYHDGRWLQPWNPESRVRFLEDGTVHFRPTADYGQLMPLPSTFVPADGPSPLETICAAAPAAGIGVRAWNVFLHNSRLGCDYPELCVENAFGDRYIYALCPAQPEVQRYVLAMVRDLAAHEGLSAIEFEALGWMGWKHGSHHDKASFAPKGLLEHALSLCFCERCRAAVATSGGDPERVRQWARELYRKHIEEADAMAPAPVEGVADEAAPLRSARIATFAGLWRSIVAALPDRIATALQVHPSPLFAGSQAAMAQAAATNAGELVITAYGENPTAIEALLTAPDMVARGSRAVRLSFWPKAPQFTSDQDLERIRDLCVEHGIESVAIYHLGLLPFRTIERAARALTM